MSLWLQLPEQGVLGIAKPSFVDRVALIAVFWSGRRELHRRPGPCQVARGIWEEKPVCVHPAKPERSLQCCFGLLLPDNLLSMSLGGSLGPEPLSGDPETLLKGKESPKKLFLAFLNSWTFYRGVSYFPLRFPPQIWGGGLCSGLTMGVSNTRLFRFYLSYLAPTTFPETHDGFARNNGIEMNVWTGYNHFSVRRYW